MRCPKCQYISFGSGARCRNCGYDFSLSREAAAVDLPIQLGDEPIGPLRDLPLGEKAPSASFDDGAGAPRTLNDPPGPARAPGAARLDLPLFQGGASLDDAPLVTPPAVPRAPLAVRKASSVAPPARARPAVLADEPEFLDEAPPSDTPAQLFAYEPSPRPRADSRARIAPVEAPAAPAAAPLLSRAGAAALDLLIVGGIDAVVVYFTLRLCGLTTAEMAVLPKAPLLAFLLMLNGGYFVLFTAAGGQTIGKMAAGLRVVMLPDENGAAGRVTLNAAFVRAIFYLFCLLPAGIGLLPVLFSAERRGLHDRFADTRVVRA